MSCRALTRRSSDQDFVTPRSSLQDQWTKTSARRTPAIPRCTPNLGVAHLDVALSEYKGSRANKVRRVVADLCPGARDHLLKSSTFNPKMSLNNTAESVANDCKTTGSWCQISRRNRDYRFCGPHCAFYRLALVPQPTVESPSRIWSGRPVRRWVERLSDHSS